MIDTEEVQNGLIEFISVMQDYDEEDMIDAEFPQRVRDIATYQEAGILTTDKGFVITFDDGSEFQITIIRSK